MQLVCHSVSGGGPQCFRLMLLALLRRRRYCRFFGESWFRRRLVTRCRLMLRSNCSRSLKNASSDTSLCRNEEHILVTLFSGSARKPIKLRTEVHRYLDEALAVAHEHLRDWNPRIQFCGLPNEAQLGYKLTDDHDGQGKLLSQRPDMWVLRWKSPLRDVYEEWAVTLPPPDTTSATGAA